jgi:protein O-GlcNAc transferase
MQARVPYSICPLCTGTRILEERVASCSHHAMYQPPLPETIRWMRCAECSHNFTDGYFTAEALTLLFSKVQDNQRPRSDHPTRMVSARMIEKVRTYLGQDAGRWLDVGFGNGALMTTAAEYGFTPVGLDLRQSSVELMTKMGFEAHAVEFESFAPSEPFSVISMSDVLEHMPFPRAALRHAKSLLRDDGALFLSMPNDECFAWRAADAANGNPYWGEIEHYHNFGRKRLCALLAQEGFGAFRYGVSERYLMCMELLCRPE